MLLKTIQDTDYIYNIKKLNGGILHTNIILIGYIISQMKKGFSPIIIIVGKQRIGKSFVAVWIAWRIHKFFHENEPIDIKNYTFYDPLYAIEKMSTMKLQPLIIDEAGAYLNKMEFYGKINIALDKIVQTQGYLGNCYIFLAPFGSDVGKTFRKHFSHIVHVRRRGVITVKEIPKRYDDLTGKVPKAFLVEQIKIGLNCVPKQIWRDYEEYSKIKKEELRKNMELEKQSLDYWKRYKEKQDVQPY